MVLKKCLVVTESPDRRRRLGKSPTDILNPPRIDLHPVTQVMGASSSRPRCSGTNMPQCTLLRRRIPPQPGKTNAQSNRCNCVSSSSSWDSGRRQGRLPQHGRGLKRQPARSLSQISRTLELERPSTSRRTSWMRSRTHYSRVLDRGHPSGGVVPEECPVRTGR